MERSKAEKDPGVRSGKPGRRLERLRYRGYLGGFIARHRALLFSPSNPTKIAGAVLLPIAFLVLWYLVRDHVSNAWLAMFDAWRAILGVSGYVTMVGYEVGEWTRFSVPYLYVPANLPGDTAWWLGVGFVVVLVVGSFLISHAYLPVAYLLRIVALFQGCAQFFFAFWPNQFPYSAAGYIHGMLIAGLMLITLIPVILGFTYYLFDFSLWRKIGLTLMMMVHLAILIPLQYAVHAYILHHCSLLFLPVLFFVFGLPLNVLVFIAFYTWGFSWKNRLREERVQWKIRRRFV